MDDNIDVLPRQRGGQRPGRTDLPKGFVLHHVM